MYINLNTNAKLGFKIDISKLIKYIYVSNVLKTFKYLL